MKIIKPGVLPVKKDEEYRGKCRLCGCEVLAGKDELKYGYSGLDAEHGYYVLCPTKGCERQIDMERVLYRGG